MSFLISSVCDCWCDPDLCESSRADEFSFVTKSGGVSGVTRGTFKFLQRLTDRLKFQIPWIYHPKCQTIASVHSQCGVKDLQIQQEMKSVFLAKHGWPDFPIAYPPCCKRWLIIYLKHFLTMKCRCKYWEGCRSSGTSPAKGSFHRGRCPSHDCNQKLCPERVIWVFTTQLVRSHISTHR